MSETTRNWKPGQVTILWGTIGRTAAEDVPSSTRTVAAVISGPFAIHRPLGGSGWNVTHVPTGLAIVNAKTPRLAREFVEAVASLADWETVGPGPLPPEIRDAVITAWHRARGAMFVAPAARASEARP
jgi:hypothetical protein